MAAQQRREPFAQAPAFAFASVQRLTGAPDAGRLHEQPYQRLEEEWQDRLRSLQQWICELLLKNQQLRMLLESAEAPEGGDRYGYNISSK
jgi:hypothetical protein